MAKSPAHKLGQLIGNFIEKCFIQELNEICTSRELYLDVVGTARSARNGKKVSWTDVYGSKHDLDIVIERNGTEQKLGDPVALIECAWRRYTKHSKNKAQEIQGAVLPIAAKYKYKKPFLGTVIAGDFTNSSIDQLSACGFITIYFKSQDVFDSFREAGVDIAYDEETTDDNASQMITIFESLTSTQKEDIFESIIIKNQHAVTLFKQSLEQTLDRQITSIIVASMFGSNKEFSTVDDAITFIQSNNIDTIPNDIKFEHIFIRITYSNGDKIEGNFKSAEYAEKFLIGNAEC